MFKINYASPSKPLAGLCAVAALAALLLLLCAPSRVPAQSSDRSDAERQRAIQLINQSKYAEALPLFEKLAAANPSDGQVMYGLGLAILFTSKDTKSDEARQQARLRARTALLRAKELGVRDNTLETVLNSIRPDGGEKGASKNKDAVAAMREADSAFPGDLNKAAAAYERAFRLDPSWYEAALYAGSSHFMKKDYDKAGELLARAVAVDPDRETAHRYWGGALMMSGKPEEARARYVDAIIAEPYNRMSWNGLALWAQRNKASLAHPRIQPPNVRSDQGNKTTLAIDPKILSSIDGSNHWLMYDLTRVAWAKGDFFKEFPNEKVYRHSLREEAAALRMVAEFAAKDVKSGQIKSLEQSLAALVELNEKGLLEAYVLLARADQGIALDYAAYRQGNRDKLRRYLTEYAISASK